MVRRYKGRGAAKSKYWVKLALQSRASEQTKTKPASSQVARYFDFTSWAGRACRAFGVGWDLRSILLKLHGVKRGLPHQSQEYGVDMDKDGVTSMLAGLGWAGGLERFMSGLMV